MSTTTRPLLRAACAAAAPDAPDVALAAVIGHPHRLLTVRAVYIDVASSFVDGSVRSR